MTLKNVINGSDYKKMVINAAAVVENQKQALNDLNVFPVPDGDTGSNMSMTINHAVKDLAAYDHTRLGKAAEKTAMSLTRGSHGNSGVITSLLFGGIAKYLKDLDEATPAQFAAAMKNGVEMAYSVVNKPAEGTILTVARKSAEAAIEYAADGDFEKMFDGTIARAYEALAETPLQNPVLAKAGVVDAGGKGYCLILEGMLAAIRGITITRDNPESLEAITKSAANFSDYKTEDIRFGYCTELIVLRNASKADPSSLRSFLDVRGDSLVLVADDEIIKIHVHTNHPGQVLEECLKYGALTSIKIENMREQHTEKLSLSEAAASEESVAAPEKQYGFVAVAAGDGIKEVFMDLGVDLVVEGGQTMNPSTEDILKLINQTPSEIVFVLPNNKNIILAAEQTVALTEKRVIVLPTRTIPEGVTAMLSFDPEETPERNQELMTSSLPNVRTGHITYAARDSVFDDVSIKEGDYLALLGGKLCDTDSSLQAVSEKLADGLNLAEAEFVTVFYGADASPEDRETVSKILTQKAGKRTEFNFLDGGQPVYYFIIGVE